MAATFNTDIMTEIGKVIGNNCLSAGVAILYGPGNNIHRTPYGGRNFEYYSEDGFLSGKMSAYEVAAIQDRCLPRYQEIRDKDFYYIVTAAEPQHSAADETISGLRGYLRCLPGATKKGIIYGTGTWDKGDVYRHPSFARTRRSPRSAPPRPGLSPGCSSVNTGERFSSVISFP